LIRAGGLLAETRALVQRAQERVQRRVIGGDGERLHHLLPRVVPEPSAGEKPSRGDVYYSFFLDRFIAGFTVGAIK
jgi:hypothetical protein